MDCYIAVMKTPATDFESPAQQRAVKIVLDLLAIGVSGKKIADRAGVSYQTIYDIADGKRPSIRPKTIRLLLKLAP